jgi:type IV secretory pathway VirB2 component (pilin)
LATARGNPEARLPPSGSLSAVQQLAAAIGSAAITSIWFGSMTADVTSAMIKCLAVVAVVLVGCMALVGLLPRQAAEEDDH